MSDSMSSTEALTIAVMKMLHHLISPYDLSESNMKMNWLNNPYYRRAVESIVDFIESKTK